MGPFKLTVLKRPGSAAKSLAHVKEEQTTAGKKGPIITLMKFSFFGNMRITFAEEMNFPESFVEDIETAK